MVRSKVRNLKKLLKSSSSLDDDFEIVSENYTMLTPPGEHYGSIMLAVDVTIRKDSGKQEDLNLVAKIVPANQMLRVAFNTGVTFKKEVLAYLDVVPALEQLQKEYNVPRSRFLDIFPKCYGARIALDQNGNTVDDDAAIVFDNLKIQGYVMEDRLKGFDLAHAKMIVQDLAKFHAVPIALRLLKPEVFEEKVRPSLVVGANLADLPPSFVDSPLEHAETIEELAPYRERLKTALESAYLELRKPRVARQPFATIIHNDYWVNNTMVLRDDQGKPVNNKMVDLQLTLYDSGVFDLLFFLFSSVRNPVLDEHFHELLKLYHETFVACLGDYKVDLAPFSWEAFSKEVEEVGPKEVFHVIVMVKPIFTERGKITHSLEDFEEDDWNRTDLLGDAYRNKLKDTVIALGKRGWL